MKRINGKKLEVTFQSTLSVSRYFTKLDNFDEDTGAEMLFTSYIVECNLSMACFNRVRPLFKVILIH